MFGGKPQTPKLSPEEAKQAIAQFKALSPDRKKAIARVMRTSCAWCEGDLKVPNLSFNHGVCKFHMEKQYKDMGIQPPKKDEKDFKAPHVQSFLTPEEIELTVKLHAAVASMGKHRLAKYDKP